LIRKLRLGSGLILFSYVTLHLINHAAGLWSLQAMNVVRDLIHAPWWSLPGTVLLYGAMLVHVLLAFYAIYQRRRFKLSLTEGVQLFLGLTIPIILAGHILGTRVAFELFDVKVDYLSVLLVQWYVDPWIGVRQVAVTLAAWAHGCIGLYHWLHLKPWYGRWQHLLNALALLVPTLALVGTWQGAKRALMLAAEPAWFEAFKARIHWPDATEQAAMAHTADYFVLGFLALLACVLGMRLARAKWESWRGMVRMTYDDGQSIQFPPGRTILEASRAADIPHASVCGGRGRCSTCRVRITRGAENLSPASAEERNLLERVRAGVQVRLACQARTTGGSVDVMRLLPVSAGAEEGHAKPGYLQGEELEIAILFADLRAFTRLSEKKLPYDVVFLLNRYFDCMGEAVAKSGGHLDKFIGDGVMALFGIESGPEAGSRAALAAARQMSLRMAELNRALAHDLDEPLRIGIGIHCGPTIVGKMGYGATTSVTAIGDTVNTASRLETQTKEYGAELVVSDWTVKRSGLDLSDFSKREVTIRGRSEPMTVYVAPSARELPE
jgi:adenylate cyclase